jgi:hypothetical protein
MDKHPAQVVEQFWSLMASNDFRSVGSVLADEYVLEWPQSKERIRGRDNFASMNQEYPAHGRWQFIVNKLVASDHEVVTDVSVSDGVVLARVISFFTVQSGLIARQVEYWPDEYPAPEARKHLVEPWHD